MARFRVLFALVLIGCLERVDPPPPTAQVAVPLSPSVTIEGNAARPLYLAGPSERGFCSGLFDPATLASLDGRNVRTSTDTPHNCFVELADGAPVPVDAHEVTNRQYQLCVDSGACRAPDPSKITKGDVCRSEGDFDDCPVVGVTQAQASLFCEWNGRRLPTGVEHALVRQAGLDRDPSTGLPTRIPLLPNGDDEVPALCEVSVLANGDCRRPYPILATGGDAAGRGAAPRDVVRVPGGGVIFDLIGNVAELLADLAPATRGTAQNLPWFCVADLPERVQASPGENPFSRENPPRCPSGAACVRGRYQPAPDLPLRSDWAVCIAAPSGQSAGRRPVAVGGSYLERLTTNPAEVNEREDRLDARAAAGIFARRDLGLDNQADLATAVIGRRVGFRCVGQRASATGGEPLPEFNDRVRLVPRGMEPGPGPGPTDAGATDVGSMDAGSDDAGSDDTGDAGADGSAPDAGPAEDAVAAD